MAEGHEIQFIVDRLNEPPFSMQLTMVAFDEKSPFELLEIVNELMANLSEQHRTDLRDETPEATATRMLDFLRVLNYKMVRARAARPRLVAARARRQGVAGRSLPHRTSHRARPRPNASPPSRSRTSSRSTRSRRCFTASPR